MSNGRSGRKGGRGDGAPTIVVRKIEESSEAHHGGAWKIAYADFVTAMMAFFLLMWLVNATTDEQRKGLADYFSPTNLFGRSVSGSGAPFGGTTPNAEGNMVSNMGAVRIENGPRPAVLDVEDDDSETPAPPAVYREGGEAEKPAGTRDGGKGEGGGAATRLDPSTAEATWQPVAPTMAGSANGASQAEVARRAEAARRDQESLEQAADRIRLAVSEDPHLTGLARQLSLEHTPEGLRIQLLDSDGAPMFSAGAGAPNERGKALLRKVSGIAAGLGNTVSISGHTDASPFRGGGGRSNWDLSSERANATRRLLVEAGVAEARIHSVAGMADRELLVAGQPTAAANRRVSILLLRAAPPAATTGAPR